MSLNQVNCVYCGKLFEQHETVTHKFCSPSCRDNWWNRERRQIQKPQICPNCEKEFVPIRKSQKYCSDSCKGHYLHRQDHPAVEKQCSICGQHFTTTDWRWKRCSECSQYESKGIQRVSPEVRFSVLSAQGNKCWVCKGKLEFNECVTHHLDGSGSREQPNNSVANLIGIHKGCHRLFHQIFLVRIGDNWFLTGEIFKKLDIEQIHILR